MKRSILASLVGAHLTMFCWMIGTNNLPTNLQNWVKAIAFASIMGSSCGIASAIATKPRSEKTQIEIPSKPDEQIIIGRINKMIAEGSISPECGIEVREAIAHQVAQAMIKNSEYSHYPPVI